MNFRIMYAFLNTVFMHPLLLTVEPYLMTTPQEEERACGLATLDII